MHTANTFCKDLGDFMAILVYFAKDLAYIEENGNILHK